MRLRSLLVTLVFGSVAGASIPALAGDVPQVDDPCPAEDALQGYVDTVLRVGAGGREGAIKVYYRSLKPFDASKPTLLIINGGPGGDHTIVDEYKALEDEMNVVSFDHRGLGCTKVATRHDSGYETGLYSIGRAADDLDALRKKLVGEKGDWFVYGISYGGMLAQKYAIKYPSHITGLILDSTFYKSEAIDVGRKQYQKLFIEHDPKVKSLFDEVVTKYPDSKDHILRKIWGLTYSYYGRTEEIKSLLEQILGAATADAARDLYKEDIWDGPMEGMSADIICGEIWDFGGAGSAENDFYFADYAHGCDRWRKYREPMAWGEDLKKLPVKTFVWAGAFDPVTPVQVSREAHGLIAGSLFWENAYSGHGLFFEKQGCALKMMRMFFKGDAGKEIQAVADSSECTGAPELESHGFDWKKISGSRKATF